MSELSWQKVANCAALRAVTPAADEENLREEMLRVLPSLRGFGENTTNYRFYILAIALALLCFKADAQECRGTSQQRLACTPDAFRLCGNYIPDPEKVELCLRRQKSLLSAGCRLVFEPPVRSGATQ